MEPSDTDKNAAKSENAGSKKKALSDLVSGIRSLAKKKKAAAAEPAEQMVCCKGIVHIAYRGLTDDRMYISYSRRWNEIRYFRPHGLRVFCADCRHRVL